MKHQEFIDINNGKFVEVAGSANALNQCVDLANAYLRDVLDHPMVKWTNAIDFPEKLTDFEWIENTPLAVPKQGDLMIFFGYYGHISIFHEGDVNTFRSFDQNFPENSPAHIQEHNYNNVFGWLRSPEKENMVEVPNEKFEELVNKSTKYDAFKKAGYESVEDIREIEILLEECKNKPIIEPVEPSDDLILNGREIEYEKNGKTYRDNYMVDRAK